MDEKPKSIWKKTIRLPQLLLVWLGLMVVAIVIFVAIMLVINTPFEIYWLAIIGAASATVLLAGWIFVRWLCCWRNLKRSLFALACCATLVALFYAEENWRGKRAWENYKREWAAKGEKFNLSDFVPPPVSDDQNFALTPIVFTSYGQLVTRDGKMIPPDRRDTNFVNRLQMNIARNDDWAMTHSTTNGTGDWQAATIGDLKVWQNYYRTLTTPTNEFPVATLPQTPAQDVLLALSKNDPAIEELRQAAKLPFSRFPLEYDKEDPAEIMLPHLAALKQCSRVLQLRALAELENGQAEKSLADIKLSLRLADSVRMEPIIITHLVRISIFEIALQPIYEGLAAHRWSDAQLAALETELAKLNFPEDYGFSVRSERAFDDKIIDYLEQKRSRYRQFFGMVSNDGEIQGVTQDFFGTVGIYLMPKGWFEQNKIVLARLQQRNLGIVDAANQTASPKLTQQVETAFGSALRPVPFNCFARLLLPSLGSYAKRIARGQTAVNLARVAIALERHRLARGEFPESLDALAPQFLEKIPHDVIGGQPLKYRRTGDGQFVLYSIGWNEKDDGGVVVFKKNSSAAVDSSQGDWVWRYPQK